MPARIIFKAHYLSGKKAGHIENYIEYMGTRPGVEIFDDDGSPATEKQKQLIEQLLEDCGKDMTESFEYEDYLANPTKANASAAITACLDGLYGDTATKENYIDYIANRPRVEKLGKHGLFSQTDAPIDLEQTASQVAHQGNNVWTNILSLSRADAEKTGFDNAAAWRDLLRGKVETIARNYKIPLRDFVWYAAFHDEGHHPHVHFVCYSEGKDGFLTEKSIENIKSSLAHEIFRQDFSAIYEKQTQLRTNIKDESTQLMDQLARSIAAEGYEDKELLEQIVNLKARLDTLPGKKQYGYLPKDAKVLVDDIANRIAGHENIAKLYDLWYEQKEEIMRIYNSALPERLPLSENREFTSVKNMIIREVDGLSLPEENLSFGIDLDFPDNTSSAWTDAGITDNISLFDDFAIDLDADLEKDLLALSNPDFSVENMPTDPVPYPDDEDAPFALPDDADAPPDFDTPLPGRPQIANGKPYIAWSADYRQARLYLFGNNDVERDFEKALQLFLRDAQSGNALAMYDLGRMYADGLGMDADAEQSAEWYGKAFRAFCTLESEGAKLTTYLQYRIGKMYDAGLGTQQDYAKAAQWYGKAVDADHKYAEYSLASLYARGRGVEQNLVRAFDLYHRSAEQDNPYACYELAKMLREGVGTNSDPKAAEQYFQFAFQGFSNLEADVPDDKLEYRLGQMLHTGTGTEQDDAVAEALFEKSASAGNVYAQYALAMLWLHDDTKDVGKAVELLEKATEGENAMAQYALGKLYLTGEVVDKDVIKAETLLLQSAEHDNAYAQYRLGKLYLDGADPIPKDVDKALTWLQKSAEQNNPFAQYTLGKLYLDSDVVAKDVVKAEELLLQSAEQGNASAQYRLGKLYLDGMDPIQKNVDESLAWLQKAADQDNPFAQYTLGKLYLDGDEVKPDLLKAEELLQASAEQDNPYAAYRYGCLMRDVYEAEEEALQWIQKAAESEHPGALYTLCQQNMRDDFAAAVKYLHRLEQLDRSENSFIAYYLGKLYLMDENKCKNVLLGIAYLSESADMGNDMALYALGKLYLSGKEIPKNIPLSVSCFERAANLKNSFAEYQLGQLYLSGIDVPKDVQKGLAYLQSSAEKENESALYALGKLYLAGEDVPRDVNKAISYLQRAADKKNSFAHYQLGKLYLNGELVPKDIAKVISHLEEAANLENDAAMYTLGVLYLNGDETLPKDINAAVFHLEKAAEKGNDFAQYQLGKLYFIGDDVQQDVTRGLAYLEQAVSGGNDTAMLFLGRAYLSGNNVPKNIQKGLELLRASAACGNTYAAQTIDSFYAGAGHAAVAILYKLSMMLRGNTAAMTAKAPVMPAVDRKEWISILRKKAEQGMKYD